MKRDEVFVSYAHADAEYLARLKVHLRPFERAGTVSLWSDTKIKAGDLWKREIENALDRAAVAILLVTADFLASDYVAENELPPLLKASQAGGLRVIPVILKPCAFTSVLELAQFQAINDPQTPLIATSEAKQEELWCSVAKEAKASLDRKMEKPEKTPKPLQRTEANLKRYSAKHSVDPAQHWGLCSEELRDPAVVSEFHVYSYEHLDELGFMSDPSVHFDVFTTYDALISSVKKRFRSAGWEGDGNITLFWLPPFVGAGAEDTQGICVWHVKQSNNGTSWLMSPVPLPFGRLLAQQI